MYGEHMTRVGDTHRCFTATRATRGWCGPYGQHWSGGQWTCTECGQKIVGDIDYIGKALDRHADRGHSPCELCGKPLLKRMDGTTRQHSARFCPNKTPGHRIEREFVKNMTTREYR